MLPNQHYAVITSQSKKQWCSEVDGQAACFKIESLDSDYAKDYKALQSAVQKSGLIDALLNLAQKYPDPAVLTPIYQFAAALPSNERISFLRKVPHSRPIPGVNEPSGGPDVGCYWESSTCSAEFSSCVDCSGGFGFGGEDSGGGGGSGGGGPNSDVCRNHYDQNVTSCREQEDDRMDRWCDEKHPYTCSQATILYFECMHEAENDLNDCLEGL